MYIQLSTRGQTMARNVRTAHIEGQCEVICKCKVIVFCFYTLSNLELSHHGRIIFFIFIFSTLQLESTAEISETLKLWNFLQFTRIHL